ncbi:Spc98 family-domain-containing protein [Xylariomycetidae sp. FL2044]|nr:Spc98 family-domain-containing protein [Xylariomycetidae sp. FL2044]
MAFTETLGALTEELIEVITLTTGQSDPGRFNTLKESGLRKLRHHNFLRTNQFEVAKSLEGFEERFRVLNKDGLADALSDRLDALADLPTKWTPDALHFLLQLSDQPAQKSRLSDLDLLKVTDDEPAPNFNWDDIAKEDGWDPHDDLWKNVDFAADSSGDDFAGSTSSDGENSEDTSLSSVDARHRRRPTHYLDGTHDTQALKIIHESQSWRLASEPKGRSGSSRGVSISESTALREIIFMLHGLENSLFDKQGLPRPSQKYNIAHASAGVYDALLSSFSNIGRQLILLRNFAKQTHRVPLLQVFHDGIAKRLRLFEKAISRLEAGYVDIQQDVVVSLARLLADIEPHIQPLSSIVQIVQQLQHGGHSRSFQYLELLFDAAAVSQIEGDDMTYNSIGELFFECFQVYLRPIRCWMEAGQLMKGDKTFFISRTSAEVPRKQVWTDQYKLRRTADGALHVPRFLQPASSKIFTTGKSVVVLKLLGKEWAVGDYREEPSLQFDEGFTSESNRFAPFSEVFLGAFNGWMQSKHHAAAITLRQTLFDSCNLRSNLDGIHHVYLMTDGARSDMFASALFNNIELLDPRWHDRLNLTEVAHEAFDNLIDPQQIMVSVPVDELRDEVNHVRKSVRSGISLVRVTYRLSWPIRILLSDETLQQYQTVFTYLLQLRRAKYVLHKHHLMPKLARDDMTEQTIYSALRWKLLWFCNVIHSYLTTLVIEPITANMRNELENSEDIDDMIKVHMTHTKRMIDEACLGSKLDPIRQCVLDIFDLTIRLQDARQLDAEKVEEETQELSRLSMMASTTKAETKRYVKPSEEEDETFLFEQDKSAMMQDIQEKTYAQVLGNIQRDFDRHLKFICSGLRGVARASGNAAAAKWDTLAEMLEAGVHQGRR